MDCKTAHLLMHFARPQFSELEASAAADLQKHLTSCAECAQLAESERALERHLGSAMRDVPVPEGLRDRLLFRLALVQAGLRRRRIVRAAAGLSAAAAVLLACWLGLSWQKIHPPTLDLDSLETRIAAEIANPSQEQVQDWLDSKNVKAPAPAFLNYLYLSHYHLADLQGRQVPLLFFTRGKDQARVYILSGEQFNLKALQAAGAGPGSLCKIDIRFHPDDPGHAYVVVHTGTSLEPFLLPEKEKKGSG